MPELRHDPVHRRWIIIATERARRPVHMVAKEPEHEGSFCPFCPDNESATPSEIQAIRDPGTPRDGPGWKVRVVPNKYPALRVEGNTEPAAEGLYDRISGIGAHEVIIESPHHDISMAEMDYRSVERVIQTYMDRQRDLFRDRRLKYALIFKNHGLEAGATLAHPHTQLIATPITPLEVSVKLQSAQAHYLNKARCLFCDILAQELATGSRLVWVDSSFVVFAPYASRFPFELTVMPRRHSHNFMDMNPEETAALARVLRDTLRRLKTCLQDPPYNFMVHTAPNVNAQTRRPGYWETLAVDFHWHLEIIPRLTHVAGFESGSGFYINPTPPEEAAAFLRETDV